MAQPAPSAKRLATRGVATVLLTVAIVGTLWVPIYSRSTPKLGPFPFFYWYQFIWIPVAAVLCWVCYVLLRTRPAKRTRPTGRTKPTGPTGYAAPRHGGGGRR